jgi:hypothetical protein
VCVSSDVFAKGSGTLLDKNWLDDRCVVLLDIDTREFVLKQIELDVELLSNHNLMDYSLLIGVAAKGSEIVTEHCFESGDGEVLFIFEFFFFFFFFLKFFFKTVYQLGLIDYLQLYDAKKKVAHSIKAMIHDGDKLSSVPASLYASRFVSFLKTCVFDAIYDENALI